VVLVVEDREEVVEGRRDRISCRSRDRRGSLAEGGRSGSPWAVGEEEGHSCWGEEVGGMAWRLVRLRWVVGMA
jgi:hypothetical protein